MRDAKGNAIKLWQWSKILLSLHSPDGIQPVMLLLKYPTTKTKDTTGDSVLLNYLKQESWDSAILLKMIVILERKVFKEAENGDTSSYLIPNILILTKVKKFKKVLDGQIYHMIF